MLKEEILELLKGIKDGETVDDVLAQTDFAKNLISNSTSLLVFKDKVKNDKDFKAFLESENDKYHSKALKTWKENNLEKELEPFIQSKYPDLITDPAKKEAMEAKKEIEKLKAEMARKDLLNEATKYALEKKLPVKLVEKFLGEDLEATKSNLDNFAEDWSKGLETMVNEKMKSNSYVPGGANPDGTKVSIGAAIAQQNNKSSTAASNPWADK